MFSWRGFRNVHRECASGHIVGAPLVPVFNNIPWKPKPKKVTKTTMEERGKEKRQKKKIEEEKQ